jgi:hypothetical protein
MSRRFRSSGANNARDAITGLLAHDGVRFLQALEGERVLADADGGRSMDGLGYDRGMDRGRGDHHGGYSVIVAPLGITITRSGAATDGE